MMLIHIPAMPPAGGAEPGPREVAVQPADRSGTCAAADGAETHSRTLVISYSHTGNNDALAGNLALALGADHRRIVERRERSMGTIILDMALRRMPRVDVDLDGIDGYELVLLVGPVWMGQIAAPFRACLERFRSTGVDFGFVSICGGADGPNPGLEQELMRRTGRPAAAMVELHIADLLPQDPAPQRKDTMAYRLAEAEVESLARTAARALSGEIKQRSRV